MRSPAPRPQRPGRPGASRPPAGSPCPGSPPRRRTPWSPRTACAGPARSPSAAITSATASNTRSGRSEAAIRLRQCTSAVGSNDDCSSDRPHATFHRMSKHKASAVWASDSAYSSFSTSTAPTRSAGSDGRPVGDGNRSAVKLSGNSSPAVLGQEREHAASRHQAPGDIPGVPQIPVQPRFSLHEEIIPDDRTHCRQTRRSGLGVIQRRPRSTTTKRPGHMRGPYWI